MIILIMANSFACSLVFRIKPEILSSLITLFVRTRGSFLFKI